MPNLREEIVKLKYDSLCNHRIAAINDVLALFDKLNAARCVNCSLCASSSRPLYCGDCITRGYKKPFPPDETLSCGNRPAREKLLKYAEQEAPYAKYALAMVEAIDALAERLPRA